MVWYPLADKAVVLDSVCRIAVRTHFPLDEILLFLFNLSIHSEFGLSKERPV